jgi:hypothetical protein
VKSNVKTLIQATSTPLASIFGSGFLIIVPILAGVVGELSVFAMAGVCVLAYVVGSVIRFNIRNAEPVLADKPPESALALERTSDLALVAAYIISVCLYLHILSSFVLGGFGIDNEVREDLLTTSVIVLIMGIGIIKGLKPLEFLEQWALYITLGIILAIFVGFGLYDASAWQSAAGLKMPDMPEKSLWQIITVVAGTLIVVQGFETPRYLGDTLTPRYLGDTFDTDTRIRSSRWSQIFSTGVYLAFIALATPILHELNGQYDDNSLIELTKIAAGVLVVPLIAVAALSQFSAAVADTMTATGNLQETTHGHLKARWGYVLVGGGAIMLCWSANTLEITALASRAFAFYYMVQCLVGITVSNSARQKIGMIIVAALLAFIAVFAVPAS